MNCPHSKEKCTHLDAAGLLQLIECKDCDNYPGYLKIRNAYPVEQLLNFLPNSLIKEHKQFFRYSEVFDLKIERDALNNWVITYINDMSMKTLFNQIHNDIHTCLAMMITELIENKYISI